MRIQVNEREIIEAFSKSRKKWVFVLLLTLAFFFGGIVLQITTSADSISFYSAFIAFLIFSFGTWFFYRCPKCGAIPQEAEGVSISPKVCPKCGVKLV